MARQRWWMIIGVLGLLLHTLPAYAQPGTIEILGDVTSEAFPTVTLTFRALDGDGRSITGLGRDDLQLLEDTQPVALDTFEELPQPAIGASVGIVYDSAPTVGAYLAASRGVIESLLGAMESETIGLFVPATSADEVVRPLEVPAFVDASSRNTIINYLRTMMPRNGETLLYDALEQAIISTSDEARRRGGAAVVVVLSDGKGKDTTEAEVSAIQSLAKEQGVRIVAIGLGTTETLAAPETGARLSALALSTDGAYVPVEQADAATIAATYTEEFPTTPVSHYRLAYTSARQRDGQPHTVRIDLRDGNASVATLETSFTAPQDTTRLRPLARALGEYLLFAVPTAILLVVGVVAAIEATRRVTSQARSQPGGNLDRTETKRSGTKRTTRYQP